MKSAVRLFHFGVLKDGILISLISLIAFSGVPENGISAISVVFGSCVAVWAAWVEVEVSGPTGGILSQMFECV